jgi:hypothetical protein
MMRSSIEKLNIGRQLMYTLYMCVCASPTEFEIICNLKTELREKKKEKKNI